MEHLRAGWRMANPPHLGGDGLPHVDLPPEAGKTRFETLEQSGLPDDETYVIWRGPTTFVVLNVFPYTTGHLMVLPRVAVVSLLDLAPNVYREMWDTVRTAVVAIDDAFHPDGINIGVNQGEAGGGSEPDHLHVHVVPRWRADTNFLTSTAETRILPITLSESWQRLRDSWPE